MQRTKALGLLHKTLKKDSSMTRQGIPDHVVIFRKPGDNDTPIEGELKYYVGDKTIGELTARCGDRDPSTIFAERILDDGTRICELDKNGTSIDIWQHYASPVWDDINQTNTLQFRSARDSDDERHICPLQLDVIERCNQLWSVQGDVVFSPFLGIGSEGYVATKMGRKFIGTELKPSYFKLACENVKSATENQQSELF